MIKSLNRIKEGYELAVKAGNISKKLASNSSSSNDVTNSNSVLTGTSSPTESQEPIIPEYDTENMIRQSIEQYKESLDKITDASILLSQCLQDELKSFNDIKRILEDISTEDKEE